MSDKIEIEYITTVAAALQAIEKINKRLDAQEVKLQTVGQVSKKAAEGAVGSFNKLEAELKDNEAQLKKLAIGTKEFEKQKVKVDELRKSLGGAKQAIAQVGGETQGILSGGVAKVTQLVAGMATFQTIVTAVVSELEKAKTLRLEAAATTRTFEQALADVGQNIGAEAVPKAKSMILEQAPKLGVTQEGLANLLGIAISAGAKDLDEAMSLTAATLKLTVGDAAKAQALVGGTLDVASLGGSQNFEGALGQLLQTQSQVRSTNLSEFAANIGPGLAAATANGKNQQGVSTERALEMASVISQIIKDQSGSNTATTMRYLFTRMNAFVPEKEVKLDDGGLAKVTKDQIDAFNKLRTFDERLQMMQKVPAIGQQFLETQRESIGKTAISEIIARSDRAVQFENKAKQNISSIDDAQKFFTDLYDVIGKETATLTAERQSQANIQTAEVIGGRGAEGQAVKILEDTLSKVNLTGVDFNEVRAIRAEQALRESGGESPNAIAMDILKRIATPETIFGLSKGGRVSSEEDRAFVQRQIETLDRLNATLDRLDRNQKPTPPSSRPKDAPLPAATVP